MNLNITMKYFNKYEEDTIIQNYIAQANSRFILYNAKEAIENFPRYTEGLDEKCLHIAFSYLNFGWCFLHNECKEQGIYCIEKAAEILEHLYAYNQCEKTYQEYYSITCAIAYYVASHYSKSFIVLKYYTCDTELAKIIKFFLNRNFSSLEEVLKDLHFINVPNSEETESEGFIYTKILSKSIVKMLRYVFYGNSYELMEAKKILLDLINLSEVNSEAHLWWIFRLLYLVLEEYEDASLWTVLTPVISNKERCIDYIRANIYKQPSVVELFRSQRECININLNNNEGVAIGMPTSSGKTKIAEIAIIKTLSEWPDALCIYIAPFRSLANEVENSFTSVINSMGYVISHLYGSAQSTQIDRQLVTEANVVVATPEKIKSILRSNPDLEERIKLVVVDEGHLVGAQLRYIASELLIEEIKITLKKTSGKLILLSAVLPNLSEFAEWISGNKETTLKSSWRPSVQRFGELNFVNHTVNLSWDGEQPSFNNKFIEAQLIRPARKTKSGKIFKPVYFPNDKKEAVGATAVKMLSMGSVLIYVGRSNMVLSQARVISKLFVHQNVRHEWQNTDDLKYVELACEEAYGKNSEIYLLLLKGIVCHSSKLPIDVRQGIERLMSNGSPKVIVATSTLGQGVNIGVSTVIISNVYLDQDSLVDVKDFWNIAGRAGRAFTDTEGKILFTIDRHKNDYSIQNQISNKDKYFERKNIEKAESGILILLQALYIISEQCGIDYESFLELLSENRDIVDTEKAEKFFEKSSWLLDLIDDTLISMDLKSGVQGLQDCSDWIDDAFRGSLAYIQAKNSKRIEQNQIIDILKARNKGVIRLSGSQQNWKSIACSSVPLKASLYIDERINEISRNILIYIESTKSFTDLMTLIQYLDIFVSEIPINLDTELIKLVKSSDIREKWYSGDAICEIENIDQKAIDVCNKYYAFHFPWIINAISKKLNLNGNSDEASILENISLFSEIGVPNIESAKVYLAGIKSRECAIELSKFINIDTEYSINEQLFNIFRLFQNKEITCSEKAYRWLNLLDATNKKDTIKTLKKVVISINEKCVGKYDELMVKQHKNKLYLCSYDYNIKLQIRNEFQEKYKKMINLQGVFFEKQSSRVWELKSRNPYIKIISD
ncbi:DEAD/DEAH box helicase [Clostridium nigeriense]|uniref:DEAD/DEAH box helicase n=1 Tax=Clostridium nigeriense TaxID=1805470 RepID=UPI000A06CE58|nr:DEAD/DEAH box helicase [Clostridium nigeriense]